MHAATLALASNIVLLDAVITAIGARAAVTALSAFSMPAPHSLLVHAHSPFALVLGHCCNPAGCGNALALASIRAISCGGVKFALTARISAATPETIGAEKLVPRLGLI